ncbi:hypothetical protein ABS71_06440 [bacterium SCN 62-11]|nr:hypothetical protein [Candidatus Eremiobacteraeota bacterium]ODT73848.1 MAG: hypothetical protein ABS71_06440 [bacterium SCN 62-11]
MEIQRSTARAPQYFIKRVDEPTVATHMAELAVDVADSWSAAPRLAPAVFAGVATSQTLLAVLNQTTSNPWVQVGVAVGGGVAAAAAGGYFGPAIAQGVERMGEQLGARLGVNEEKTGIFMRAGFKAATLAGTYALAPGVGSWLMGGETMSVIGHMTSANNRSRGQRSENLTGLKLPEGIQPEAGQQLEVNDKGFSKTFLITRLPE